MTTATADRKQQARAGARKARALADQLERAAGIRSDAARMKANRAVGYDLEIPPPRDLSRRAAMLADPYEFMRLCFPDIFYQPFTPSRRDLVEALRYAGTTGGKQAWADARAGGKTRCALFVGLWLELIGAQDFVLIVSKSGARAARELRNVKQALRDSPVFAQDFPEVGVPIQSLRGQTKCQTAWGVPTDMEWTGADIVLPTITTEHLQAHGWPDGIESLAHGQVWSSLGILGPLRGYVVRNRRPGLAIVDDIDDRGSARSELQTENRIGIINEDVTGLGGSDSRCSVCYLCTIPNRMSCAFHFTDPIKSPAWNPRRTKLISKFPDRLDLWAEYVRLRNGRTPDDPDARESYRFYLRQRGEMERGYEATNPYHFDATPLRDGEPAQVSAIQSYYDWVADSGESSALSELQNDPPELDGGENDGLTPHRVQHQISGFSRGVIPPGCMLLTMGIDVGKFILHWAVIAWRPDGTSYVIDYGTQDVRGTSRGSDEGIEIAIASAIRVLVSQRSEAAYHRPDGEVLPISMTLVDEGYYSSAVRAACREFGEDVSPAKGEGPGASESTGRHSFTEAQKRTHELKPGEHWKRSAMRADHVKLFLHDAAYWKDWGAQRWLTAIDRPGCRFVWGEFTLTDRQRTANNAQFSHQAIANGYRDEIKAGQRVRVWGTRPKCEGTKDHWQDAIGLADVAANVQGVRLRMIADTPSAETAAKPAAPARSGRLSFKPLSEMGAGK